MALTFLVDTSAITRLSDAGVRERFEEMVLSRSVAVSRLAALELGFSARHATEWDDIQKSLHHMTILDSHDDDTRQALLIQRELSVRGLRGRKIVDLLVASTALRTGLIVMHYDQDFDHIASVTGQPTQWIAPRGSLK